jgi:hypothetical protein
MMEVDAMKSVDKAIFGAYLKKLDLLASGESMTCPICGVTVL